jgi:LysM repeat protein
MDDRSPARLLAPAALVAGFIALILVVSTSGGGEDEPSRERSRPARTTTTATPPPAQRPPAPQPQARFYTVKPGDILSTIAAQTGVPAQQIEELNPEVDPQGLVPGQRIRLRP